MDINILEEHATAIIRIKVRGVKLQSDCKEVSHSGPWEGNWAQWAGKTRAQNQSVQLTRIVMLWWSTELWEWHGPIGKKKTTSVALVRCDCYLSAKSVPTFADRGCHVVSATDPYSRIFGFLDRSHYCFFQVAHQLYSQSWVDPVSYPLLLRKSGSAGNRIQDLWICSQEIWLLDHRGGQ
jgi:hypothetical protein